MIGAADAPGCIRKVYGFASDFPVGHDSPPYVVPGMMQPFRLFPTHTVPVTGSTAIPVAFVPCGSLIVLCAPVAREIRSTTSPPPATQMLPRATTAWLGDPVRPIG